MRADDDRSGVEGPRRRVSKPLTISAAAIAALVVGATGLASSLAPPSEARTLGELFFSNNMARAEVVTIKAGVVHDYRIDQGRVLSVKPGTIELLERDGTRQVIPVALDAEVWVNGRLGVPGVIPLGAKAIAIRDGDQPAAMIRITGQIRKP